jgi:4-amino-4-deoxy-L-arabinose transferase-like glycosyltransferase
VAEPTTVATDLALAAVAVVLAALLRRSARPLPRSRALWVAAFLLTAVAATAGAARHALFEETASAARRQLWSATYLALGLTNLLFVAGPVGALVQVLRVGPLGPFNHNDLFHVVQMVGLWLFYRAGRLFRDRGDPGRPGDSP